MLGDWEAHEYGEAATDGGEGGGLPRQVLVASQLYINLPNGNPNSGVWLIIISDLTPDARISPVYRIAVYSYRSRGTLDLQPSPRSDTQQYQS